MAWVIRIAALLVLGAGVPLVLFPGRTGELFVFAIDPPLTAAFLGANYWAAAVIEGWSSVRRRWVDARAALPGILVFTVLTAVVSVRNLGQYDLGSVFTWVWMGVYALFPVALAGAWVRQRRAEGRDPARTPLPVGLRALLGVTAVMLLGVGAGLVVYPGQASAVWAWELTTPNAAYRTAGGTSVEAYVGCWCVGMGLVAAGMLVENDARRARPCYAGMVALLALHMVTLARFGSEIDWSRAQAWGLAAMLLLIGAAGVWGLLAPAPEEAGAG